MYLHIAKASVQAAKPGLHAVKALFHNEIEEFHGSKPGVGNFKEDVYINKHGLDTAQLPAYEAKPGVIFAKNGMGSVNVTLIGAKKCFKKPN